MHNRIINNKLEKFVDVEHLFNTIYELAKDSNERNLNELHELLQYVPTNIHWKGQTPTFLLAKEKAFSAVDVLLKEDPNCRYEALKGYAAGKQHVKVQELLSVSIENQNLALDAALIGYAMAGDEEHIQKLAKNPYPIAALTGFALAGNTEKVEMYLKHNADYTNRIEMYTAVISGYIAGKHYADAQNILEHLRTSFGEYNSIYFTVKLNMVQALAQAGDAVEVEKYLSEEDKKNNFISEKYPDVAAQGFMHNYFLTPATTLQLLSSIKDKILREKFGNKIANNSKTQTMGWPKLNYDILAMLPKANKLNLLMAKANLNYRQAFLWLTYPNIRTWLFEGVHLVKQGRLPRELHLQITTFAADFPISVKEGQDLYTNMSVYLQNQVVSKSIHDNVTVFNKKPEVDENLNFAKINTRKIPK